MNHSKLVAIGLTAAELALWSPSAHAATCNQFKNAMVEGASRHRAPAPKFRLDRTHAADPDEQYFTISMVGDVRAAISCSQGSVRFFLADGKDREKMSDLMPIMAVGLHAYGIDWRQALELRDQLVRMVKASDAQSAKLGFAGGEASLVISIAGVPSFEIDTTE